MKTQLHFRACLLIASVLLFASAVQAQPWTFTGPGNWDDPSKWSPSYPGLNIGFSEVTLNGDCDLEDNVLNFTGGTIYSNGNFTSSGGGVLNISGSSNFQNYGNMTHAGSGGLTLSMSGGFFSSANAGSSLTFAADYTSGGGIIYNSGSLVVNATVNGGILNNTPTGTVAGTGSLTFGGTNEGTLGNSSLTLVLNGGGSFTNSGQFHIYHSAILGNIFQNNIGGMLTIHPGATLSIPNVSNLHITSAVMNINGTVVVSGGASPNITSGTVSIGSSGELRLNDFSNFLVNTGTILNNAGTISTTSNTGGLTLQGGTLNNTGTITHNTAAMTVTLTSGTFNNNSGGILNLHSNLSLAATYALNHAAGATINVNNATTFTIPNGITFTNAGTVKSATGQTGTLSIASGATFNNAGTVGSSGDSGLLLLLNGTFNNQSGGTLHVGTSFSIPAGTTLSNPAGASIFVNNGATFTVLDGATFTNGGSFASASGQTGNLVIDFGATFNNTGTMDISTATGLYVQLNGTGTFNNLSGGLVTLQGNASFIAGIFNNNAGATINLNGHLLVNFGGNILNQAGSLTGSGGLEVVGGTFNNSAAFTHGGGTTFLLTSAGNVNLLSGGSLVFDSPLTVIVGVINNSAGSMTINAPFVTYDSLIIGAGGTLNLNSSLQILSNPGGLTLGGTFTPNNASLTINHSQLILSSSLSVSLTGSGSVVDLDFPVGTIYVQSGGTLSLMDDFIFGAQMVHILAGGTLTIAPTKMLTIVGAGVLTSSGAITGSGSLTVAGGFFTNHGSLTHNPTTGLTFSYTGGIFNNEASGSLTLNGNFEVLDGLTLTNSTPATLTNNATLTVTGSLTNSGVITNTSTGIINSPGSFVHMLSGSLVNNGTFNLTGGSFMNSGSFISTTGGTLNLHGGLFTNMATLTHNTAALTIVFGASGSLENKAGATLNADSHFTVDGGTLTNVGTITLGSGVFFTLKGNATLLNSGTINVGVGLGFLFVGESTPGILTNTGVVNVPNGGGMRVSNGDINNNAGGSISNAGLLWVSGGAGRYNHYGSLTGGGTIKIDIGGQVRNYTNLLFALGVQVFDFTAGELYNQTGATITINNAYDEIFMRTSIHNLAGATITFNNIFTLAGPSNTFLNLGTVSSTGGGYIRLFQSTWNNSGTFGQLFLQLDGGTFYNTGGTANFDGQVAAGAPSTISNISGTMNFNGFTSNSAPLNSSISWNNTGNFNLNADFYPYVTTFLNNGSLNLGSKTMVVFPGQTMTNNGTLNTGTGVFLTWLGNFTNNGIIKGAGEIQSSSGVFTYGSAAEFQPGSSPGKLNIADAAGHNLGSSTYHCEINGTTQGVTYDWLAINGPATLTDAHLVVDWGSYTPTAGESFDIMTFTSRTGTFASTTIPPVAGINFTVSYTSTKVTLNAQVLPVELIDFQAVAENEKTKLWWSTASELNADRFEVERSTDGFSFEKIGGKQAAGTTTAQQSYSFIDEKPLPGMNYYRLRQVDFDGAFEYSKVVSVDFQNLHEFEKLVRAYPNPVTDFLHIELPAEGGFQVGLFDATGRRLLSQTAPKHFDVRHLPSGIYFLEIKELASGRAAVQRVVVE